MNILIVSQYFWPEPFIINDLVLKIKEQGHDVAIFTGKPNYPDGDIYPGYTSKGVREETYQDDIKIYRVPLRPRYTGGAKNLVLNYASFVVSGLIHAFKFSKKKQFDAILVCGFSPITAAIPAILLKWLTKSNLTIWVQDLWPESIQTTGFVQNRFVLKFVEYLVKWIYARSDSLLVQSQAFIEPVLRLSSHDNIRWYPNSAVDMLYDPRQGSELPLTLCTLLDLNFCVVFAGNIGTAQAIETIMEAALELRDLHDLKIVLVGSGSMLDWAKQKINETKLDNVVLSGRLPASMMPELFSKASALMVTLRDEPIYALTIPCKVQAYLSAGKPIIAALNGEGARVLAESDAALISPAEKPLALASTIRRVHSFDLEERAKMGASGRAYFLTHFDMSSQASRLMTLLADESAKHQKAP